MAKEVDLKKIELKVSANCCEGCKRKVKKSLRSVEGVLKTEIDHSQPKLTVLGNVDPQILVKKLRKIGKQAQIISKLQDTNNVDDRENEYQNHQVQKKTDEKERIKVAETILLDDNSMSNSTSTSIIEKEKVDHIYGPELNSTLDQSAALKNCSIDDHSGQSNKSKAGDGKGNGKKKTRPSSSPSSDKLHINVQKQDCNSDEGDHHHQVAAAAEVIKNTITANPYTSNTPPTTGQVVNNFTIQPGMVHRDTANCMSYMQYSYAVEPISSASTAYYNPPDSHDFSSPNSVYYRQLDGHFYGYDERQANPSSGQQLPLQQRLLQPPVPRVGDYFSDENALGCHVM